MYYRSRRIPSDAQVNLIVSDLKLVVRLLDVSETGLKITLDSPFPAGTPVVLETGRLRITGEIRWAAKSEAGISLTQPLGQSDLGELACMAWA